MVRTFLFSGLAIIATITLINNHDSITFSVPANPQTPTLTAPNLLPKIFTEPQTPSPQHQTPSPWSHAKQHYSEQLTGSWLLNTSNASNMVWQGMIISFDSAGQFIHTSFNPLKHEYNLVRHGQVDYAINSKGTLEATLNVNTSSEPLSPPEAPSRISLSLTGASIKLNGNKLVISMPQHSYQVPPLTYHFTRLQNIKGGIKGTWLRHNPNTSPNHTTCHMSADGSFQLGRPIHCALLYVLNNTLIDVSLTATTHHTHIKHDHGLRLSQTHAHKEAVTIKHIAFDSIAAVSGGAQDSDYAEGSSLIFLSNDNRDTHRQLISSLTPHKVSAITRLLSYSEQREDFRH